ncbi:hypothetical protein POTOM_015087 [Populus tomentosa]|uniref:Uncharacterized protein n=1 Tax=Populus tomentosa TaxID=118781 RepID=A0A8X8A2G1_POPTO|nr:hypothetical protein POTOM_015087 [Populus tomentosa]
MGSVINIVANGNGGVLGNAFAVPIKTILGASCYDFSCKYHHLCVGGKQESIAGRQEESSPSILKASIAVTIPIATAHARLKTSWESLCSFKGCIMKTKECKTASISWIEKSSKRSWSFQKNGDLGDCRSEILKAFMP